MIWIDLENRLPTDTNIPGWTAWSQDKWEKWLDDACSLTAQLAHLEEDGETEQRNKLIEANGSHWTKLKPWLQALSFGKCWFSEAKEIFSDYHVEHFRPKKVAQALAGKTRNGYWWLSFDYKNYRLCGSVGNSKKGEWFPLKNDDAYATYATPDVTSEFPYFIDPIQKEDVKLVAVDESGEIVLAPGRTSAWERARIEETSKRLKLFDHENLSEERRKVWQRVAELSSRFRDTISKYDLSSNEAARDRVLDVVTDLHALVKREAELCSTARWSLYYQNIHQLEKLLPNDWRDLYL